MLYRLNRALSRIDLDFKEILHHSFYAFLMLFLAGIAQIGFDLILARRFGASDYGMFYLTFYVIVMLSLLGRLGINQAVVKYIPRFVHQRKWGELMGLKKTADRLALSFTVVIAIITFNLAPIIANSFFHKPEVSLYLRYFSIALPALSFLYIQTGVLSGLKLVGQAVFIERTGMNLVAIIIMLSLGAVFGIKSAVIGTMAGIFLFAYLGSLMIKRSIPGASKPVLFNKKVLLSLAAPLFLVDFSNQMIGQINALVLGGHVQASEVGVFNAALRLSGVISVVLTGINAIAVTAVGNCRHRQFDVAQTLVLALDAAQN